MFEIQRVNPVLGTVTNQHIMSKFARSGLDRQNAGQKFQERRFAGAIRTDQNGALISVNGTIELPVDDGLTVGVVNLLELENLAAAPFRLRKAKGHMAFGGIWHLDFVHPIDLFALALRLGGLGVLRPKPIDESLQPLDLSLLILIGSQDLFLPGSFLSDVFVVVAPVLYQFALIDLDDSLSQGVQE